VYNFRANVPRDGFGSIANGGGQLSYERTPSANSTSGNVLDVTPRLLGTYVLLDEPERKRFSAASHEYLIEQVVRSEFTGIYGDQLLDLNINHPVKTMTWYAQHKDVSNTNDWSNYTNWRYTSTNSPLESDTRFALAGDGNVRQEMGSVGQQYPPYSLQAYRPANNEVLSKLLPDGSTSVPIHGPWLNTPNQISQMPYLRYDYPRTEEDILEMTGLLFNGNTRVALSPPEYFINMYPHDRRLRYNRKGIYSYAFALEPRHYQPSGSCNMSRINSIQLSVKTLSRPVTTEDGPGTDPVEYTIVVYTVHYNVLRVMSGMASVAFENG
jgi:hypothetical protein